MAVKLSSLTPANVTPFPVKTQTRKSPDWEAMKRGEHTPSEKEADLLWAMNRVQNAGMGTVSEAVQEAIQEGSVLRGADPRSVAGTFRTLSIFGYYTKTVSDAQNAFVLTEKAFKYFGSVKRDEAGWVKPEWSEDLRTLYNPRCWVGYRPGEAITGRDNTDQLNLPSFYTKGTRFLAKAWKELYDAFDENTSMYEAARIVGEIKGIQSRTYCAMD